MMSPRIIKELDNLYELKYSLDYNMLSRWFTLTALNKYSDLTNNNLMREFLSKTGRVSFVLPIYEALVEVGWIQKADMYLSENFGFYHPTTIAAIEAVIFRKV